MFFWLNGRSILLTQWKIYYVNWAIQFKQKKQKQKIVLSIVHIQVLQLCKTKVEYENSFLHHRITVPMSWVQFTQQNIARSQNEREMSKKLRGQIDALLRACANEMWSQFNSVNNSFNMRLQQTNDAKAKLQAHLARVSKTFLYWTLQYIDLP